MSSASESVHPRRRKHRTWSGPRKFRRALTVEQFGDKMRAQESRCWICRRQLSWGRYEHAGAVDRGADASDSALLEPVVDRSPSGVVRGILCRACNRGLGCFADDPARLARLVEYVWVFESDGSGSTSTRRGRDVEEVSRSAHAATAMSDAEAAGSTEGSTPGGARPAGQVFMTSTGEEIDLRDPRLLELMRTDGEIARQVEEFIARAVGAESSENG